MNLNVNNIKDILNLNPGVYSGFNENNEVVWVERYENKKGFAIKVCSNKNSACSESLQVTQFDEEGIAIETYFENFNL